MQRYKILPDKDRQNIKITEHPHQCSERKPMRAKTNSIEIGVQSQWVWWPISMGLDTKLIEFSGVPEQRAIYTYTLPLLEALSLRIW